MADNSVKRGDRMRAIRGIASMMHEIEWAEIDLVLQQFGLPSSETWNASGAANPRRAYVLEMIGKAEDDTLLELHRFLIGDASDNDDADARVLSTVPGSALSRQEIMRLVNRYIGVEGGYLSDFNYATHRDFYPEYCDLDINPYDFEGTTRERFISILSSLEPTDQAKVVRGVLERFPVDSGPDSRTEQLADRYRLIAQRLEDTGQVQGHATRITSDVVARAIVDAENLIRSSGATSGVDRIHTALHGYLKAVCADAGIDYPKDAAMTALFKLLRRSHTKLQVLGAEEQDIQRVLNAFATIFDALNPVRNEASVAHPNENLLDEPEAMLIVNAGRTLLNYLDAKLS